MSKTVLMGVNDNGKEVPIGVDSTGAIKMSGGSGGGASTVDDISDATTLGKSLMKAADGAAARSAIGAGTSNLTLGTGAANAAAGNHTHDAAAISAGTLDAARIPTLTQSKVTNLTNDLAGKIAKASVAGVAPIADTAGTEATAVAEKINELIAALKS